MQRPCDPRAVLFASADGIKDVYHGDVLYGVQKAASTACMVAWLLLRVH
jgi:hypothetical protein